MIWDIYGISMGYLRNIFKQVSKVCQRPDTENIRKLTDDLTRSEAVSRKKKTARFGAVFH